MKYSALFIIILFISCNQNSNKIENTIDLKVNTNLLSDSIYFVPNKNLSFYPPRYWARIDTSDSEIYIKLSEQLGINLLAIFKLKYPDCILIVTDFSETSADFYNLILKDPNTYFNKDSIWNAIQPSSFKYNSRSFFQLVLQNAELIIFKIFIYSNREVYELDYVIPRTEIVNYVQSVESSIGSIH